MRALILSVTIGIVAGRVGAADTSGPLLAHTIVRLPVNVVAACQAIDATAFDCVVTARLGTDVVNTRTVMIGMVGGAQQAFASIRATTVWRNRHLFIRSECGGGTIWSCSTERVLAIQHRRLVVVGDFIVGEARRPAQSFTRSGFLDYYDKLEEVRSPLSHGARPWFPLVLTWRSADLVVNASATWALNAVSYRQSIRGLPVSKRVRQASDCDTAIDSELLGQFAQPLAIALFCHRPNESRAVLRRAAAVLSPVTLQELHHIAALVKAAEAPSAWREKPNLY